MSWLKDVVLDLIVTTLIAIAVFTQHVVLGYIVIGYSFFMLASKIILFTNSSTKVKKKMATSVPDWFYHLIYALNSLLLLGHQWWYAGIAWIAIWVLSWLTARPATAKK